MTDGYLGMLDQLEDKGFVCGPQPLIHCTGAFTDEIGGDYVFLRKPNQAFLAVTSVEPDHVQADLLTTKDICRRNGCALELILKDISTVGYEPQRLFEWARIAMDVATS
jgi:hypothetical protein